MKTLLIILFGAVIWGILLVSVLTLLPFSNVIKAILALLATFLIILFLKFIDNNLNQDKE